MQAKTSTRFAVRRIAAWLFALPAALIVALAFGPPKVTPEQVDNARTLVDLTGRRVAIPKDPKRIFVLGPGIDAFATIDPCTDRIAGGMKYDIENISQMPTGLICPELVHTPVVSSGFTPDPERILALSPDVVVGIRDLASNLSVIGYPSLVRTDYLNNVSQSRDRIWNLMGTVLGARARARELQAELYNTLATLHRELPPEEPPVRVLLMYGVPGSWRVSNGYYLNDLWRTLNADYVASGMRYLANVDQEDLLRIAPDVILTDSDPSGLFDDPAWQIVNAVRERRVYRMPEVNVFNQPLDLTITALWITAVLHPDAVHITLIDAARKLYEQIFGRAPSDAKLRRLFEANANQYSQSYSTLLGDP